MEHSNVSGDRRFPTARSQDVVDFSAAGSTPALVEERYRLLAECLPLGLLCTRNGQITYINPASVKLLGASSATDATSRPLLDFIDPQFRQLAEERGRRIADGTLTATPIRQRLVHSDGSTVDIDVMTMLFRDAAGPGALSLAVDVTDQVRAERALQESEARWRSLVQNASDLVALLNADGTLQYATPAAERLLGYQTEGSEISSIAEFIRPDDLVAVADAFVAVVAMPEGISNRTEFRVLRHDGTWCWVESIATNRLADPAVNGIVCNIRDVSDRKAAEDALRHQATHDSLTGLPNRLALAQALEDALDNRPGRGGLLLLDMDGFKDINDGLGHDVGDRVLQEMANRLMASTRATDLVARLGGDEFAVWVSDLRRHEDATTIADAILATMRAPVEIDGTELYLAASIGIAFWPDHGREAPGLLQAADIAMYRAKELGMAWAVYSTEDHKRRGHRLTLLSEFRHALDHGGLDVYFQPQIELATGAVRGAEALLRCTLPTLGQVSPAEFIPLVERTGMIRPLTAYIVRVALDQFARWRAEGLTVPMSVNLSASSLRDPTLIDTVLSALGEFNVPPGSLTLEITETALADGTPAAMRVMTSLRTHGIRLAIDDLGVGYSSLAYLKRLPVHDVKLDKSLISDLSTRRDRAIVRALIELGHNLDLVVIAEGVETPAVASQLATMGCDLAQGYLYSRPVPGSELTGWLVEHALRPTSASVAL